MHPTRKRPEATDRSPLPGCREAFLSCDVAALRKLLCKPANAAWPAVAQAEELTEGDQEPDDSLPPETPPGFKPPEPHNSSPCADVSAEFIKSLRKQYSPRAGTDEGRKIGRLREVAEWMDSLESRVNLGRGRNVDLK